MREEGERWAGPGHALGVDGVLHYLSECRSLVLDEMRRLIPPATDVGPVLYDLVLDYPLRSAKALRPALCIATCRALGGSLEAVLPSATALELYHNAFLIHDDVEDGSEKRRDNLTLHRQHGVATAINVGDAMLALALVPLLDNTRVVGLGKALRILQLISAMARESAEGQALELAWVRGNDFEQADREYFRMVHKKTSYYTFVAPVVIGGIVGGATETELRQLRRFAITLGMAFQIQDDVLNLVGEEGRYGKEIGGDLWEGKHTLILLHALRHATAAERDRAATILVKQRTHDCLEDDPHRDAVRALNAAIARLAESGELSSAATADLRSAADALSVAPSRTAQDIEFLFELIRRSGSIDYARNHAQRRARRARRSLDQTGGWLGASVHREFLCAITRFVIDRDH